MIHGGDSITDSKSGEAKDSGFIGTMISNLAFVFHDISSKKGMRGNLVGGLNYYACLSILSFGILTPFAMAMEGPQMWAAGYQTALSNWTIIFMVITNDTKARPDCLAAGQPWK